MSDLKPNSSPKPSVKVFRDVKVFNDERRVRWFTRVWLSDGSELTTRWRTMAEAGHARDFLRLGIVVAALQADLDTDQEVLERRDAVLMAARWYVKTRQAAPYPFEQTVEEFATPILRDYLRPRLFKPGAQNHLYLDAGLWYAHVELPDGRELQYGFDFQRDAREAVDFMRLPAVQETILRTAVDEDRIETCVHRWVRLRRSPQAGLHGDGSIDEKRAAAHLATCLRPRRARREPAGPGFFRRHRAGMKAILQRDSRDWWFRHYVRMHGKDPPEGWWMANPATAAGGQIAPGYKLQFGWHRREVTRAFRREMEDRYRLEAGLPARGTGWVSETHLYRCVTEALPDCEVLREARPDWLSPQRLDIYVPALNLALEYQGVQHYEPVDLFGGEEGFEDRRQMDARKREACERAGVTLIEWRYDDHVDVAAVRERLKGTGLLPNDG